MRYKYIAFAVATSALISGCGTFLAISEVADSTKKPDALVINRPAMYKVKIKINTDGPLGFSKIKEKNIDFFGVDHTNVITLNVTRMPFSDGKLSVELNDAQLIKKVELTSKTGAERAAKAVEAGFDARNKNAENQKKAKAAKTE